MNLYHDRFECEEDHMRNFETSPDALAVPLPTFYK